MSKLVDGVSEYDFTSDDAIKEAMINLKKFSLVGVLEDTENFAKHFQELFGAKLFIKKQNSNPLSKAKQQEEITDKIKNKVEKICKPNMIIYESVLERIKFRE